MMKATRWMLAALPIAAAASHSLAGEVTADQVVTAIEATFGARDGERRNHTKGMCAAGTFTGSPEVRRYSRSPLFTGASFPVVARFSLAGGNAKAPDTARIPRGLAIEIKLPGGALQHMTMLNTPVFGAATPQTFLDDIVAKKPDPATGKPDPEKLRAFRASHPDAAPQAEWLAKHNPPPSWANTSYFGIHTFLFADAQNRATPVRWRFVPQDGDKYLSDDELKAPGDFLEAALIERVKRGPVQWEMMLTVGEPGDTQDNPTVQWPAGRRELRAGTLAISSATPQKGGACEGINFDPLVMSIGIAPSNDPVLLFRSPAYGVSFGKRSAGL